MKLLKSIFSVMSATMLLNHVSCFYVEAIPDKTETMREITTMELVRDMGIGINLGNTFDACGDWIADVDAQWGDGNLTVSDYETAWGSPVITKDMIQGMADEGFGVVRVPVAWSNLMEDNYKISDDLKARVHEVVDWVIDADMYCIINIHWDNGWVNKFPDEKDECMKRFETMWTQIADSFKDYGDYLMFESQNEELGWESLWNPWGGTEGKAESFALCNEINQKFVDVIRSSGGNNPKRHLLISGYNTGFDRVCDPLFKMPDDPAQRMAVSVHYYSPAGFAILEDDADWGKASSTWGTDEEYKELNNNMDMMKTNYADKGIPVIIGEYGCPITNKEPESVRRFLSSVCKAAYDRNLCPVLWSTPGGHYNRDTCKLEDQELKKLFNEISGFEPKATETTSTEITTTTTSTTTTISETTTSTTTSSETTTTTTSSEPTETTTTTVTTIIITTVTDDSTTVISTDETTLTSVTTTDALPAASLYGDANCDSKADLSDAVLIMQSLSNPEKYKLTTQGKANADCCNVGDGVTNKDALALQKYKLSLISSLPEVTKE